MLAELKMGMSFRKEIKLTYFVLLKYLEYQHFDCGLKMSIKEGLSSEPLFYSLSLLLV